MRRITVVTQIHSIDREALSKLFAMPSPVTKTAEQPIGLKKEAFNLRFQQATGQIENTARMRSVKRDAARVKTILNEKAANAAAEQGA